VITICCLLHVLLLFLQRFLLGTSAQTKFSLNIFLIQLPYFLYYVFSQSSFHQLKREDSIIKSMDYFQESIISFHIYINL